MPISVVSLVKKVKRTLGCANKRPMGKIALVKKQVLAEQEQGFHFTSTLDKSKISKESPIWGEGRLANLNSIYNRLIVPSEIDSTILPKKF